MMSPIGIGAIPTWKSALSALGRGTSVIVHAPRHYGQERARRLACERHAELGFTACAVLRVRDDEGGAEVRWDDLAASVARQLGVRTRRHAPGLRGFKTVVAAALSRSNARLLLVASTTSGPGSEPLWFDIVSAIVELQSEPHGQPAALTFFGTDDYSLYYYESLRTRGLSRWDYLERIHHLPLGSDQLEELLPDTESSNRPDWLVPQLRAISGGHPGLVLTMPDELLTPTDAATPESWQRAARRWLSGSGVVDGIRRALSENPDVLCAEALRYVRPRPPRDHGNAALQLLRRLGVVQFDSQFSAELCSGVVRELVESFRSAGEHPDSGLGVGPAGGQRQPDAVPEDDIVVLHLSDLHLGPQFEFRFDFSADEQADRRCVAEMLAADISQLGLRGAVDAVIISGDLTDRGDLAEFRRARDVIEQLLALIGVGWERVILVAGNHDLQWNPGDLHRQRERSGVSREGYITFRELIGRRGDPHVEIATVRSRSGRRAIRVLSLDSNYVEGPEGGGVGYVPSEVLRKADELLREEDARGGTGTPPHTWLVLHHHVFPVNASTAANAGQRRVSVTANASEILEFACTRGVEMILHGHEHQPCVTVAQRWPRDREGRGLPIIVVGAGSVGASAAALGPFRRNQYFVIHHRDGAVRLRSRMLGDNGFSWVTHDNLDVQLPHRLERAEE